MKRLSILLVLLPLPAMAAEPSAPAQPSAQEVLAHSNIQIGQLLMQVGNAELTIEKLKAENAELKKKLGIAAKPDDKPASVPSH